MGPNIALTAGHSVLRRTDDGTEFRDNLVIRFCYNDEDCLENLEVTIPSSGTNLSTMVTINGTSFQLRTGPYRVSIIASQRLVCNDNIIFAFGVV